MKMKFKMAWKRRKEMNLAIMIIGIIGWLQTGNPLFMATAIMGGILFGLLALYSAMKISEGE